MPSSSEPDEYGQIHPNETPSLVRSRLEDLEFEVAKIHKKDAYQQAQVQCPNQLTVAFKLMFLRCEVFNADLAASRLIKYWEKRLDLFGPDRAFCPLTQEGAFKDDEIAMGMGFWRLVPAKDRHGRSIVMMDPSRVGDKTLYNRESMARSMWYVIHAALEDDETTQKKGIVFIVYPKHAKFANFDRTLAKINTDSAKGCLPIRISVMHVCHPPTFFQIIFFFLKLLMGERLRKRFRLHGGSKEHVLGRLAEVGLTKESLPSEIGGDVILDHTTWLAERKAAGK